MLCTRAVYLNKTLHLVTMWLGFAPKAAVGASRGHLALR